MSKILCIKANPKPVELSAGLTVGMAFLESYKKINPNDEITEINLFEQDLPEVNGDMLSAWVALKEGSPFASLSDEQQRQLKTSDDILEEFLAHDKYVFITPLWNFMFPARLKAYIDTLCVAGKTFKYTEKGPEGLVKNRKALHINSSGGLHQGAYANKYLRDILGFIGIVDMETVIVEGLEQMAEQAAEIIEKGKASVIHISKTF